MEQVGEVEEDPQFAQANRLFQTGVMLIYGKRKSIDKAIKCIQRAITIQNADYKYWQFLGEAYYQRGSLNPAINCFMKSLKLIEDEGEMDNEDDRRRREADCTYSKLRMSDIRLSVGHFDEAASSYTDILTKEPDNVAALIGLAKTELQVARNGFSAGLVKSGHNHCMQALRHSLRAIKLCPHLCLTWKLASDCCLIQFVYGQRDNFTAKIEEKFPGGHEDVLLLDKRTCIELAQQFLCKALDIKPFQDSVCLWHNLGISLYLKASIVQKPNELLRRSIKCLLKALDFDRSNSQVRNSIGVVAFHLNLLNSSQNFLIKSIQTNMSTSEIQFSNLGYMYLQKGEFTLASVAFSRCQAEEPLYSRSWLGNALINEQNNSDNLSQLRHCYKLDNNYDSQLMFATKIACLPTVVSYRRDTVNALDCMLRMINYNEDSLEANNTLGLLFERCDYFDQAKLYFDKAHNISTQDSRIVFNKLRQLYFDSKSCWFENDTKTNENDAEFIKAAEKLVNSGNSDFILNFIYFLFKNGDYKGVNTKMTRFLDKLPQNEICNKISAQILLGLAAKAERGDFKSWFYKNIIDSADNVCIESVINLLCLMLLGALEKDQDLVDHTANELSKLILRYITTQSTYFPDLYYTPAGYWIRMTLFCSIFSLNDQTKLIKTLLMLFPMIPELWLFLGLTMMYKKTKHQAAVFCIRKADIIGRKCADLSVICDILLSILTQVAKLKTNVLESRINYLSRALYKYPTYGLLWTSLKTAASKVSDSRAAVAAEKEINRNQQTTQSWSKENNDLFNLALDHVMKMLLT